MDPGPVVGDFERELRDLRARADEDFTQPSVDREPGRHQSDLAELGLRVSVTRSFYPNRPDGVDQYAVTITRSALDRPPDERDTRLVLAAAFGEAAEVAVERSAPGSRVRMFRVPAQSQADSS
ncbi:MAG: hypothetical protein JOY80_11570 [Candidatus Dormibacteraeota bacterium]|nr:hypothetical protein [Candidatus Dormibacteraeota bacterium]